MSKRSRYVMQKLPSILIGVLLATAAFYAFLFVQGCVKTSRLPSKNTQASNEQIMAYGAEDDNVFTGSTQEARYKISVGSQRTLEILGGGAQHVGATTLKGTANAAHGIGVAGRLVGSVFTSLAHNFGNAVVFVLKIPGNLFGFISHDRTASALIEPASPSQVPIIDPNDPKLKAAQQALPPTKPAINPSEPAVQQAFWPIHGRITTYFGEAGRYYDKAGHTGIDISDGKLGATPIKAFRNGKVVAAGWDNGLGNRVIVDHGSGITSVYGHMYSIAVQVGQEVNTETTLGVEGSTGVSTGAHLHFEIRVNGQATDPRNFITGTP